MTMVLGWVGGEKKESQMHKNLPGMIKQFLKSLSFIIPGVNPHIYCCFIEEGVIQ
jgi:hypothetical protein